MEIFQYEILVSITVFVANMYLGILIFSRNWKSWTNRFYFLLVITLNTYILTNFISLHPEMFGSTDQLFWIRVVMSFGSFIGPSLFFLVQTLPYEKITLKFRYIVAVLVLMFASATLSMTDLVFSGIEFSKGAPVPIPGPAIAVFFLDFVGLFLLSFITLFFRYRKAIGQTKVQLKIMGIGVLLTFSLMGLFTILSVVIFKNSNLVFWGPIVPVVLIGATAYSIVRYNLFNIKVVLVELAVFLLNLLLLLNIFSSHGVTSVFLSSFIFLLSFLFSILLLRQIHRNIKVREQIEVLAKETLSSNERLRNMEQQKTEFVSIASHQLRTPITIIKGYLSMIQEGSFGVVPERAREILEKLNKSGEKVSELVEGLLTVSRIEQKVATFNFTYVDIRKFLNKIFEEEKTNMSKLGLKFFVKGGEGGEFMVPIDQEKFGKTIKYILQNSVTHSKFGGSIQISLSKGGMDGMMQITIQDNGAGIDPEKLAFIAEQLDFRVGASSAKFEHHDHSRDGLDNGGSKISQKDMVKMSEKKNIVGVGLYFAKEIIGAHGGSIWIKSDGVGKGTTVTIEIPQDKRRQV